MGRIIPLRRSIRKRYPNQPVAGARFAGLYDPLADAKMMTTLQKDFLGWVFQTGELRIQANQQLKIYSSPDETSLKLFQRKCTNAAETFKKAEIDKLTTSCQGKTLCTGAKDCHGKNASLLPIKPT